MGRSCCHQCCSSSITTPHTSANRRPWEAWAPGPRGLPFLPEQAAFRKEGPACDSGGLLRPVSCWQPLGENGRGGVSSGTQRTRSACPRGGGGCVGVGESEFGFMTVTSLGDHNWTRGALIKGARDEISEVTVSFLLDLISVGPTPGLIKCKAHQTRTQLGNKLRSACSCGGAGPTPPVHGLRPRRPGRLISFLFRGCLEIGHARRRFLSYVSMGPWVGLSWNRDLKF